jgi:RNA polymerase sigma-70 factor (ECF subfamily)
MPPSGDDLDSGLLQDTQAYLECRDQHLVADRRLVTAWEQFYRTYDPLLRRFAIACHVPVPDLNDCAQQVWVVLLARLRSFRYDPRRGRFRCWLYTLVRNKAADLLRGRSQHPSALLGCRAAAVLRSRDGDPAAEYERRRRQVVVRRVLTELRRRVPERCYRVLYLRYVEGRTVGETAATLGLTPAQVWPLEHRGRQRFRRLFERYAECG